MKAIKNRPEIDLAAIAWQAMEKYGFEPGYSAEVEKEVGALAEAGFDKPPAGIRDHRGLLWSSIDNEDSMDLDQLEYCERGENGEIHVRVAIADVDLYVKKEDPADRHASHNGTSVYAGIVTFALFPDKLSKGITSLLPGGDRMAVVVEYAVLPGGDFRPGEVYRAIVRNKAKLVYEVIGDWFDGYSPVPRVVKDVPGLEAQLRLQLEASRRLKKYRMEQGALELDTLEPKVVVEEGKVCRLVAPRKNPAGHLIEDFMIAANGTMVARLEEAGIPMVQRVVRVPKHWDGIVETAALYHEHLPAEPDAKALSEFLVRRKKADPERFPDLSLTVVKLLGRGEYLPLVPGQAPYGHFGLAVTHYTHSTAPNRRFVDLIIQRLVKSVLAGTPAPYEAAELAGLCTWLTDREHEANKVERFMRKASAAVLLADRIGDTFEGIITGVIEHGIFARLFDPPAEGKVVRREHGLRVGQIVRLRLLRTDPYNGFIDFERVG
ncbi:MAG TPA: RNB domain-containing ribonuclease [Methanomicrobiales archaeon]|nr:RNB domain-containing ribonuclease [Methanomicrobiales archaeon]